MPSLNYYPILKLANIYVQTYFLLSYWSNTIQNQHTCNSFIWTTLQVDSNPSNKNMNDPNRLISVDKLSEYTYC